MYMYNYTVVYNVFIIITCTCGFNQFTLSGQLTTLGLPLSYQQTWNYTRIKIKDRLSLKPFGYKVMTIFTTHNCHFTTFRRLLVAKEYMESCLKAIATCPEIVVKVEIRRVAKLAKSSYYYYSSFS